MMKLLVAEKTAKIHLETTKMNYQMILLLLMVSLEIVTIMTMMKKLNLCVNHQS